MQGSWVCLNFCRLKTMNFLFFVEVEVDEKSAHGQFQVTDEEEQAIHARYVKGC